MISLPEILTAKKWRNQFGKVSDMPAIRLPVAKTGLDSGSGLSPSDAASSATAPLQQKFALQRLVEMSAIMRQIVGLLLVVHCTLTKRWFTDIVPAVGHMPSLASAFPVAGSN
ncbi:MAG: hypothetical protein JO266_04660 [Acidobacteria bacterium]|nr:hypothetical protein [Acidobacteriota bacterium]